MFYIDTNCLVTLTRLLFQFALMLEYCSKGNLRSYLIDHEEDFKKSLKYVTEKGYLEPFTKHEIQHNVKQLCLWACQVIF